MNSTPENMPSATQVSKKSDTFDPLSDLLPEQTTRRPDYLKPLDLTQLTPFQRALLAIDGTVTKFIEAYTLEAIEIIRLKQETKPIKTNYKWLDLLPNTPVIERQVLLRGQRTANIYVYAISVLIQERLTDDIKQGVQSDSGGLGRILLSSQIENRRELLWYGQESIVDLPNEIRSSTGSDFISRTYRIVAGGKPIMLINERFPLHCKNETEHS